MKYTLSLLLMGALIGCSPIVHKARKPASPPLLKEITEIETTHGQETRNPEGVLTLKEALALALVQNPGLKVFDLQIRIREAQTLQSGLFPNPEFGLETENIAGSGGFNGLDASETTVSIGQLIELAGKREKRARVAALQSDLAYWDYATARLNVFSDVMAAYAATLAAQQRVAIQKEFLNIAETFKEKIDRRVSAGRLSPAEAIRAEILVKNTRVRLAGLQKELNNRRYRLAATWNSSEPLFTEVEGTLEANPSLPDAAELRQKLNNNPMLARWVTEFEANKAEEELAEAGAVPDPVVSGGFRYFNESGDNAFVAGVSIPIPLFNRNQGAIEEARVRLEQSRWKKKVVENDLRKRLNQLITSLNRLMAEKESLETGILPQSEEALRVISDGFEQGKFQFLDVMDAQRTLFEARERFLDVRLGLFNLVVEIESLIGQKL